MNKSLKVFLIWGFALAVVTNGSAFLLGYILGDKTLALIGSLVVIMLFAGFTGYKAALALADDPRYRVRWNLALVGGIVALVSSFFSSGLGYFLTGKINFGFALIPAIFALLGSYLGSRKRG